MMVRLLTFDFIILHAALAALAALANSQSIPEIPVYCVYRELTPTIIFSIF